MFGYAPADSNIAPREVTDYRPYMRVSLDTRTCEWSMNMCATAIMLIYSAQCDVKICACMKVRRCRTASSSMTSVTYIYIFKEPL